MMVGIRMYKIALALYVIVLSLLSFQAGGLGFLFFTMLLISSWVLSDRISPSLSFKLFLRAYKNNQHNLTIIEILPLKARLRREGFKILLRLFFFNLSLTMLLFDMTSFEVQSVYFYTVSVAVSCVLMIPTLFVNVIITMFENIRFRIYNSTKQKIVGLEDLDSLPIKLINDLMGLGALILFFILALKLSPQNVVALFLTQGLFAIPPVAIFMIWSFRKNIDKLSNQINSLPHIDSF